MSNRKGNSTVAPTPNTLAPIAGGPGGGPKKHVSTWRTFDTDGDGKLEGGEIRALERKLNDDNQTIKFLKKAMGFLVACFLIQTGMMAGVTYSVVQGAKEIETDANGSIISAGTGTIVSTTTAEEQVPLIIAPVLPVDVLGRIKFVSVTAYDIKSSTKNYSSAVLGMTIADFHKLSDTEIVLISAAGNALHIKDGAAWVNIQEEAAFFEHGNYKVCPNKATHSSLFVSGLDVDMYTELAISTLSSALSDGERRSRRERKRRGAASCGAGRERRTELAALQDGECGCE